MHQKLKSPRIEEETLPLVSNSRLIGRLQKVFCNITVKKILRTNSHSLQWCFYVDISIIQFLLYTKWYIMYNAPHLGKVRCTQPYPIFHKEALYTGL